VPASLIWSTNRELKILTPYSTSAILTSLKTPFSSRLLSFLRLESVYKSKGGLRSSYKKINMLAVFCRNYVKGLLFQCVFRRGYLFLSVSSCSAGSSSSSLSPNSGSGSDYK
jgi:hypothetical protein